VQGGHSPGKPGKPRKVREFQSGQGKVRENGKSQGKVRETSTILDFEQAEELKVAACGSLWAWTLDMFIIDTLVAFSKLVTMLVIINMKQRLFKRYAVY